MKLTKILSAIILVGSAMAIGSTAFAERTTGRGTGPVVFVTSQGLYYDSIVIVDPLPQKGNFQQLLPDMYGHGLATEFGPGEQGYLGGRWWIDLNEDGVMDSGDKFFLCPLLGPGRDTL